MVNSDHVPIPVECGVVDSDHVPIPVECWVVDSDHTPIPVECGMVHFDQATIPVDCVWVGGGSLTLITGTRIVVENKERDSDTEEKYLHFYIKKRVCIIDVGQGNPHLQLISTHVLTGSHGFVKNHQNGKI